MTKKLILFFFLLPMLLVAQNLQIHYDFGKDRHYITSTLEMFKPDKWGNTYYFVDFNYDYSPQNHPSLAYMEIARCLKFWDGPLGAHVEYNGGLGGYSTTTNVTGGSYAINNAWLVGFDYALHNADFTKTLTFQAMFKHIVGKQESAQFTTVWGLQLMKKKITLSGFADLWAEKNTFSNDGKTNPVFISEPQFWYNFTEHFSIGSETEYAVNMAGIKGLTICPTLAVKWNF